MCSAGEEEIERRADKSAAVLQILINDDSAVQIPVVNAVSKQGEFPHSPPGAEPHHGEGGFHWVGVANASESQLASGSS